MEPTVSAAKLVPEEEDQAQRREQALYAGLDVRQLSELPADQRFTKILSLSLDDQLEVADSLRRGKGKELLEDLSPKDKETLLANEQSRGSGDGRARAGETFARSLQRTPA
jgi:hypothetical protein